ncbi:MAG: hypothetical protein QOH92_2360 [Chloroflexota bacterium]|jgi:hypothetical protein|nr:hypothetical protein [Chloroflexota bacterium]
MRPSWKLALIGGEVTVLAAFTGLGVHLAIQPHRSAFRPPPLVLPSLAPPDIPTVVTPLRPPAATAPLPAKPGLGPELFQKFGREDRNLLVEQWGILQRLTTAIEAYVEARVHEQMGTKR